MLGRNWVRILSFASSTDGALAGAGASAWGVETGCRAAAISSANCPVLWSLKWVLGRAFAMRAWTRSPASSGAVWVRRRCGSSQPRADPFSGEEWRSTSDHLVSDNCERVDIAGCGRGVAAHLFRRDVQRRAHDDSGIRQRIFARDSRYSEVRELGGAVLGDEDVAWFDVAMYDPGGVRVSECARSSLEDLQRSAQRHVSGSADDGVEGLAANELGRQVGDHLAGHRERCRRSGRNRRSARFRDGRTTRQSLLHGGIEPV